MNNGESHDNDDAAWLLARERGTPGATVSAASMARYARLEALIADLPAVPGNEQPRAGWKQDVLAVIDAAEPADPAVADGTAPIARTERAPPARRRTARRWVIGAAVLAAAAAAVVLLVSREPGRVAHDGSALAISFEIAAGGRPHRSTDASVGDTLTVRGGSAATGELRIYDATGTERARCAAALATPPGCTVEPAPGGPTLKLVMSLRAPGAVRAVLFAALPAAPSQGIDRDIEAAQRAGIAVKTLELVDVH